MDNIMMKVLNIASSHKTTRDTKNKLSGTPWP